MDNLTVPILSDDLQTFQLFSTEQGLSRENLNLLMKLLPPNILSWVEATQQWRVDRSPTGWFFSQTGIPISLAIERELEALRQQDPVMFAEMLKFKR